MRSLILDGSWVDAEAFVKTIFDNISMDPSNNYAA